MFVDESLYKVSEKLEMKWEKQCRVQRKSERGNG